MNNPVVKSFTRLTTAFLAMGLPAGLLLAGPEPMVDTGKETQAVRQPVPCDWQGFYIGANAGGQFGQSKDTDLDGYNSNNIPGNTWKFDQAGFSGGLEAGYNWQWRWLVLGPEVDGGFMNSHGHGVQPNSPGGDTRGESDGDVFTTFRGRIGVSLDRWLVYATGGGIAAQQTFRTLDNSQTPPAGPSLLDARTTDFNLGFTVGGGIERKIGCHWSVKAEYLYYNLESDRYTGHSVSLVAPGPATFDWRSETLGHILRLGLNYKF